MNYILFKQVPALKKNLELTLMKNNVDWVLSVTSKHPKTKKKLEEHFKRSISSRKKILESLSEVGKETKKNDEMNLNYKKFANIASFAGKFYNKVSLILVRSIIRNYLAQMNLFLAIQFFNYCF
jgi:hypothetical protein